MVAADARYRKTPTKSSSNFPKLTEFFKKKPEFKRKCKLSRCDVEIRKDLCVYRAVPKKSHCLIFRNAIAELIPEYKPVINKTELKHFQMLPITELYVNTCSRKVTFQTNAEGKYAIFPKVFEMSSVEAGVSIPIPLGDFQLFGGGEWAFGDTQIKVKFTKDSADLFSVKGYSEIDYLSIQAIAEMFDVDILPNSPASVLLKNIDIDKAYIRKAKIYGFLQPLRGNYELAFSGEPMKGFQNGHIRVFITKVGNTKNLAILLELQDYSPVTLLKKMYGPLINKINVLRDRNQTIALYISSLPTANFSSTYTSHGSSRWIHRDSVFGPGAYLLVTLPFPKRKALDMKIELLADGLAFTVPESENLAGDIALGAISPERIMHIGVDTLALHKNKDDKKYSKINILKFKYFIFNDTYLAAAESHLSVEEELEELMPIGRPGALLQHQNNIAVPQRRNKFGVSNLDVFFKREETERENDKRDVNNGLESKKNDPLTLAENEGLL